MSFEKMTATEARNLRREVTKRKSKKKIVDSAHTKALKKADAQFSIYCRAEWAQEDGGVRCCTCGVWKRWKMPDGSMQCGHWQSRGCNSVRFDFHNVGPQCLKCNYYGEGYKERMRVWLEKTYGVQEVQRIEIAALTIRSISDLELHAIAAHFKKEAEKIIKQKGLT